MDRDMSLALVDVLEDIKGVLDDILVVLTPATPEEPGNDNT